MTGFAADYPAPTMEISGFVLVGAVPGSSVALPLDLGLTALYGFNGVGKSRILGAIESLTTEGSSFDHAPPPEDAPSEFSQSDRAYIRQPFNEVLSENGAFHLGLMIDEGFGIMWDSHAGAVGYRDGPDRDFEDLFETVLSKGRLIRCSPPVDGWMVGIDRADLPTTVGPLLQHLAQTYEGPRGLLWDEWHQLGEYPWMTLPVMPIHPDLGSFHTQIFREVAHDLRVYYPQAVVTSPSTNCDSLLIAAIRDMFWSRDRPGLPKVTDDEFGPALDYLGDDATRTLRRFLGPDAPKLRVVRRPIDEWHFEDVVWWEAEPSGGQPVPVDQLSTAQHQWASIAIQQVLAEFSPEVGESETGRWPPRASLLIIDEPERALHPSAVHRVATALSNGDTPHVIAATHSPIVLGVADQVVHVQRGSEGELQLGGLESLHNPVLERAPDSEHGLMRSDFLSLARVLVLVEGSHDRVVIRQLLGEDLVAGRALITATSGSRLMAEAIEDVIAFRALDCPVLCVVDDFTEADLEWWQSLDDARRRKSADTQEIIKEIRGRASHLGDRWHTFGRIAEEAARRESLNRVHLAGFPVIDIPQMLPPAAFGLSDVAWAEVNSAVEAADGRLTSAGFKREMERRGAPITKRSVLKAALEVRRGNVTLGEREEAWIRRVGDEIRRLGSSWPASGDVAL